MTNTLRDIVSKVYHNHLTIDTACKLIEEDIESKVREWEARGYERYQKELAQAVEVWMMVD